MTSLRERMIGDMELAGLSPRTRQAYTQAVKRLAMHYYRRPDRLDEEAVRAFLVGVIKDGIARGTFKRVHFGLKFFYTTTLGRDWPLFSKKNRIRLPKQKRLPEALSDHQVRRLLASVRSPTHRTCLLVMYGCGLRIGEAVRLEVGAVDSEHGVLSIVAGKGGRDRRVSLPLSVLEALRALWRTHRHPRWLFPNRRGTGPVDTDVVAATFRAAAAEAGIRDRVTAHVLRHSYATRHGPPA